jgi:hypothetical protein
MWIETDHHGMVNLDYVKRIDLSGDMDKKSFGIYLFDVDGDTYPIVDIPRFKNIGVLQGNESERDIHAAVYTFYTVTKRLIAGSKGWDVITIEAIYKEFASEWYTQQRKEIAKAEQKARPRRQREAEEEPAQEPEGENGTASGKIHQFSDMKQFLDVYSESYRLKFNKKPSIRYQTEGKIARELIKLYPLEKLKTMLQWYFDSDEDFITKSQYDMKTFKAILERNRKTGSSPE